MDSVLNWISVFAALLMACASIAAIWVAYRQLAKLDGTLRIQNKTLRMQNLTALLHVEKLIYERREKMLDISHDLIDEYEKLKKDQDRRRIQSLERRLKSKTEDYLSAVDRLAFCILKGFLPELDWRSEYRELIATDIRDHEEFFGPGTRHTNVVDLHEKWSRE